MFRQQRTGLAAAVAALVLAVAVVAATTAGAATASTSRVDRLLAPAGACPGSTLTDASVQAMRASMACLVAFARAEAGLPKLRESRVLDRAGALKIAADIRCGDFTHTPCGKPFQSVFTAAGFSLAGSYSIGENLAWGQAELGSPQEIMQAWLNSPEHRANLLSKSWSTFGLATQVTTAFLGYEGVTIWANEFAGAA